MTAKKTANNVLLGLFVLAGLAFLILLLYMIGRNSNLFQSTYTVKARFTNIQGLVTGNNVRFAGIESGTVKKITIVNDSSMEVTMVIDSKLKNIIRKNAVASIGTEGLVGNKVLNITPSRLAAPFAADGDVLEASETLDTDAMMRTLSNTNNDVAIIAAELKTTVQRINNSLMLWELLNDKSIPKNIKASLENIRLASEKAASISEEVNSIVYDVRRGKGTVGALLTDTSLSAKLNNTMSKLAEAGSQADSLGMEIRVLVMAMNSDINNGPGTVNTLFKDSSIVKKLHLTLDNLQMGTNNFNQNMEALKHNILFRGYFRKLQKEKKKNALPSVAAE